MKSLIKFISTLKLMEKMQDELYLVSSVIQFLKQLKTSELCAQEKMELETKELNFGTKVHTSTESFLTLWHKEETSLMEMVEEENLSMEINLMTRTLN